MVHTHTLLFILLLLFLLFFLFIPFLLALSLSKLWPFFVSHCLLLSFPQFIKAKKVFSLWLSWSTGCSLRDTVRLISLSEWSGGGIQYLWLRLLRAESTGSHCSFQLYIHTIVAIYLFLQSVEGQCFNTFWVSTLETGQDPFDFISLRMCRKCMYIFQVYLIIAITSKWRNYFYVFWDAQRYSSLITVPTVLLQMIELIPSDY